MLFSASRALECKSIPLSEIDIDLDWNSRSPANVTLFALSETDEESSGLDGLIANLLKNGQSTPVDIRPTVPPFYKRTQVPYSLVTGFRRCTALQAVYADEGLKLEAAKQQRSIVPLLSDGHVLAIVHPCLSEREAYLLNARENSNRESLTPPDTAMMVKRGVEQFDFTIHDLSVQLGKTPQVVALYAKVAALPPPVLSHWQKGGEFEGVQSSRRVAFAEMVEIAKRDPLEHIDAYRKALIHGVSKQSTSAWFQRARGRAGHVGSMLAKLQKNGFLTVQERNWVGNLDILAGMGKRGLKFEDIRAIAEVAQASYEREMKRPMAVREPIQLDDDLEPIEAVD